MHQKAPIIRKGLLMNQMYWPTYDSGSGTRENIPEMETKNKQKRVEGVIRCHINSFLFLRLFVIQPEIEREKKARQRLYGLLLFCLFSMTEASSAFGS